MGSVHNLLGIRSTHFRSVNLRLLMIFTFLCYTATCTLLRNCWFVVDVDDDGDLDDDDLDNLDIVSLFFYAVCCSTS